MKRFTKFITTIIMMTLVWANFSSTPNIVSAAETDKLNYLYLDNDQITVSQSESVVVSYGDEQTEILSATLTVKNTETGAVQTITASGISENVALFCFDLSESGCGYYQITDVCFTTADGSEDSIALSETGMEDVIFLVSEDFSVEDADIQVVSLDADSSQITGTDIQGIQSAIRTSSSAANPGGISTEAGEVVVFLDPGHDATHAGARKNGIAEEALTLRIAQYCREELETYYGVRVYMSRSGASCPFPGTSAATDNQSRVAAAARVGANIYVSIHLNSAANSGVNGAEVFYPNANYRSNVGSAGANLAKQIERQLVALGLGNRGISIRNSGDGTKYPDGSLADYYAVIRNSKLYGIPGIIVEHAFLTNSKDAAFLSSESNLRALGIADATGIAQCYNLSKGPRRTPDRAKVEAYVTRLYQKCLGRNPDAEGLKNWTNSICSFERDGEQVAYGFVFSSEMQNRNLSDEDYVEILYNAFLGRASDPAGKADWVYKLKNGASRYGVYMGFANSGEFQQICDSYGIEKGTAQPKEGRDRNLGLTTYICRLYTKALGRGYDTAGLNDWCNHICDREWTITDVSTRGFFNSEEFLNKHMSDDEYVKTLYRTFFDREYDQGGYDHWMNRLATGTSRNDVLKGFANSKEFSELKTSYGVSGY